MTVEEAKRLLRVLGAAYPGTPIDEDVVTLWANRLGSYPADLVMACAVEWVDNESRFPRVTEFLDQLQARRARLAARNALEAEPCTCSGALVEVRDSVTGQVLGLRPCQRCNPAGYELWVGGHMEPGHHCPDCEDRKKGRRVS